MVNSTNAIEDGIKVLVKKLKGKELILIPILMIIFSIGGTTYGMLEETVGFYALLAVVMVAAGMDTIVFHLPTVSIGICIFPTFHTKRGHRSTSRGNLFVPIY